MEDWKLDSRLEEIESANVKKKVENEIYLTKFSAVMADKIFMAAKLNKANAEKILNDISKWIDFLEKEYWASKFSSVESEESNNEEIG